MRPTRRYESALPSKKRDGGEAVTQAQCHNSCGIREADSRRREVSEMQDELLAAELRSQARAEGLTHWDVDAAHDQEVLCTVCCLIAGGT